MDLSRIKDPKLIKRINEIARTDGGKNTVKIDSPKGFQELGKLLSNGINGRQLNKEEQDIISGLCIEYQSNNTKNLNNRDNINVTGKNNNTTGRISNSNVVVGNNNQIVINNITNKANSTKYKVSAASKNAGSTLAKILYNETVDSIYAYNDRITTVLKCIDNKTAYSFFKEYQNLKNGKSDIIQDIYKVSDIYNRITLDNIYPVINSLLSQAKNIGLMDNDEYKNLELYTNNIKTKGNKDPTKIERIHFDYAIQTLLDEMSKVYGDK